MIQINRNKKKLVNDPVHGFLKIPSDLVYDLIEHPIFQRLRRIKQLGLTFYVYPGATHTRFHHALGAVNLMVQAISGLRSKDVSITDEEEEAVIIAILLHDLGHGPFSHALEETLIKGINHEYISNYLMNVLNREFDNKLELAIKIFNNQYQKAFLHQLVSSQLDMDRMDYLTRDSFYTGVSEGVIGTDRIIKMLNVHKGNLVMEAKGIYSIEKFLIARRLMYWQVYLHKTVVAAEILLVKALQRAKELAMAGKQVYATPPLDFFLKNDISRFSFSDNSEQIINEFLLLDDNDIFVSVKQWMSHEDFILSELSKNLIYRKLPKVQITTEEPPLNMIEELKRNLSAKRNITLEEANYFVYANEISNYAYSERDDKIEVLYNDGRIEDVATASDILNVSYLYKTVKKYFLCFPKNWGD